MSSRWGGGLRSWMALGCLAFSVVSCSSCRPPSKGAGPGSSEPAGYWSPPSIPPSAPVSAAPMTPETISAVADHPRLLVRGADLARLRSWAVPANPMFAEGLDRAAKTYAEKMDSGAIAKDPGTANGYSEIPTEGAAELFAFMSLVSADSASRDSWARRARTLLMSVMDKAAQGVAKQPFREKEFSVGDRSRWTGEGFALTVDWIYGSLSAADKATIRKVFLRWADELIHAETTNDNHPEPIGLENDPTLTKDRRRVRWAANNYYTAHLRNLGLMSLAFDAADDPDEKLRSYLKNVTGAWLYVSDAVMRGDMAGGLAAEGFQYSPQAIGYVSTFLTALATAGKADPRKYGTQATYANPFWDAMVPAYLHSLSPVPAVPTDSSYAYLGPLYSVAWYGDGEQTWAGDAIGVFGPLGLYDQLVPNEKRLAQLRWIQTNVPAGGPKELLGRARGGFSGPILYFLLFDPKAPVAPDPRPALPLTHFAPGLGRILARTSWAPDASWFTYKISWMNIDHQTSDGNMFELYRKGEWLVKQRTGYGSNINCTDYQNSLALENDPPHHNEADGYRAKAYRRGSQWPFVNDGDGKLVASSIGPKVVYALGDSTALYNSSSEGSTDIVHASRSIVWLAPDRIVTYDRAVSKTDKRFKRYWLNFPANGVVDGSVATMTSPKGQKLFVRSLLPSGASIRVEPAEPLKEDSEPAKLDPIRYRLRVEATGGPKSARFLHVLTAGDGDAKVEAATLVRSTGGTSFEGAWVSDIAILFPVDVAGSFTSLVYSVPATTKAHVITGLAPGAGYNVVTKADGQAVSVSVTPNGPTKADGGGLLVIGQLP